MFWIIVALYCCTVLIALGVFVCHPKADETSVLSAALWPAVLLICFGIFLVQRSARKDKP